MSAALESRAARIRAPGRIELEQRDPQAPGAGQVRIRLQGCGVCASNLPVWQGRPWFTYPFESGAPGHEGWGIVDGVGEGVTDVQLGERVAFLSGHAYADHDFTTPGELVRLPAGLAQQPFPGEPLACAMNIFRRAQIQSDHRVAVVGVGFIGAVVTALAVLAGAEVIALSRRPFARKLAEQLGASATFGLEDAGRSVREARQLLRDSDGYERVIECVGSQEALDMASALTGTRARLVIAGYHQDGDRRVNLQQWNWRGLDVINAHERDPNEYLRGMQEAVELVDRGELDLSALLTHQFPLADVAAALDALALRPDGFLKAVVLCQ